MSSTPVSKPDPTDPVEILARTLWGEARGEDRQGREMVANVIMNRVNADLGNDGKPDWWGEGVVEVCLAPWQFSCWLPGDPNRAKLVAVTAEDRVFAQCLDIAAAALAGDLPDRTAGATHYLNPEVTKKQNRGGLPKWVRGRTPTAIHGRHHFFRLI